MRKFFISFFCVFLAFTELAMAQVQPPIPRPRPDRDALSLQQEPGTGDQAPQSEALDALTNALEPQPLSDTPIPDGPPQPVTLSAKVTEDGAVIPQGLVWRVFDTQPDSAGQLALRAKSETAVATFELPPGDYVIHAAYGRSQATDTLRVGLTPESKIIVLDSGALQLKSAISGDIAIKPQDLRFEVYAMGGEGGERVLLANDIKPDELLYLNAGTYNVVSYFGATNAEVRADLRVEPGKVTAATLYHRASQVSFKLASSEGGEAIADVDWKVYDQNQKLLFSSFGAFPSLILTEGDYSVIAKRDTNVYNRDFHVRAGPPVEVEVLTSVY